MKKHITTVMLAAAAMLCLGACSKSEDGDASDAKATTEATETPKVPYEKMTSPQKLSDIVERLDKKLHEANLSDEDAAAAIKAAREEVIDVAGEIMNTYKWESQKAMTDMMATPRYNKMRSQMEDIAKRSAAYGEDSAAGKAGQSFLEDVNDHLNFMMDK